MVCEQSTDVFELGLAILDLYNNKECMSRSDIYSLFEGSEQAKTLLDGYIREIANENVRNLVVQMLETDKQKRLRLQNVNLSEVFGSSLYYKSLNIPGLFGPSNDANLQILQICLAQFKKQQTITCSLCYNQSVPEKLHDAQFFVKPVFSCTQDHSNFANVSSAYKRQFVEDADAQKCLVNLLTLGTYLVLYQAFNRQQSYEDALKFVAECYSLLKDEVYISQALDQFVQLLHLKLTPYSGYVETCLLRFFTFVLNATDKVPENHLYTPLYVFSRFYLVVENWHQTAQELIQSLRHNTK